MSDLKETKKRAFSVQLDTANFDKVEKLAKEQNRSLAYIVNQLLAKCSL